MGQLPAHLVIPVTAPVLLALLLLLLQHLLCKLLQCHKLAACASLLLLLLGEKHCLHSLPVGVNQLLLLLRL